jgi:hypothetical protein
MDGKSTVRIGLSLIPTRFNLREYKRKYISQWPFGPGLHSE